MHLPEIRKINISKLLFLFAILIIPGFLFAQNDISISDTVLSRSGYVEIPVNGTLKVNPGDNISIEIVYDSRIIDIKSAAGGTGMAITEPAPAMSTDFVKLDSAKITITSSSVVSVTNGIICKLMVRGLVYSDSVGYILPVRLLVNGKETSFTTRNSRILVKGNLIFPNYPDNLGEAVPNPFFSSTRLNFSLEKTSKVKFILYNLAGLLVAESGKNSDFLRIYDAKTNQPADASTTLNSGGYYLIVSPDFYQTASGFYMLVMMTDRDIYNKNLIFNK